jgi:hypothetical protein
MITVMIKRHTKGVRNVSWLDEMELTKVVEPDGDFLVQPLKEGNTER